MGTLKRANEADETVPPRDHAPQRRTVRWELMSRLSVIAGILATIATPCAGQLHGKDAPTMRSPEELFQELRQRGSDTSVYEVGLAIAFEYVALTVPATVPDALTQIRRAIEHGGVPVGFLWFDRTGLRAAPLREWSNADWAREMLLKTGNDLLEQLEARTDSGGNHIAVGRHRIPKSLRAALRAAADQAARQGDRVCALFA